MAQFEVLQLIFNPFPAKFFNLIFTHLNFSLPTAIHNFKWVKITPLISDLTFTIPSDWTSFYLTKTGIWYDKKSIENN